MPSMTFMICMSISVWNILYFLLSFSLLKTHVRGYAKKQNIRNSSPLPLVYTKWLACWEDYLCLEGEFIHVSSKGTHHTDCQIAWEGLILRLFRTVCTQSELLWSTQSHKPNLRGRSFCLQAQGPKMYVVKMNTHKFSGACSPWKRKFDILVCQKREVLVSYSMPSFSSTPTNYTVLFKPGCTKQAPTQFFTVKLSMPSHVPPSHTCLVAYSLNTPSQIPCMDMARAGQKLFAHGYHFSSFA